MKVLIITFGSRGDVQPYVALGKGFKAAGHEVTVCTAEPFAAFVAAHGLDYGYMSGELLALVETDAGRQAMEETRGILGAAKSMIKLSRATMPLNRQMMLDSWETAQTVQPEVVIYHPKALAGPAIAEKFGAVAVVAVLQPMYLPTADFPLPGVPALPLGGGYNRLTYRAVPLGYRMYRGMINEVRQTEMGLPRREDGAGIFDTAAGEPVMVLHGFSQQVIPRPVDWPANAYVSGYWFLDEGADWQPAADLEAFLGAGEPPVYIGFGSMAGKDPRRLGRIVVQGVQLAGVRAILASGWGGLAGDDLPPTVHLMEKAPHDWLFPRVAAVVHHGGAGTTAAGLRAGRPTLVCPFMGDQPFWGSRVYDLGAGPEPIPQKKLTVENLAAALRQLTVDGALRGHAESIGQRMRAEDGVGRGVELVMEAGQNGQAGQA